MHVSKLFKDSRDFLEQIGLPRGDRYDLPTSGKTFEDGGDFKIEIPTANSVETIDALLSESQKLEYRINRVTETYGIFRHTKFEIRQMVKLCRDYGCDLVMSPGPRASNDTSASAKSPQGSTIAYRLRGQEQVIRAIEDIKRAIDLEVKLFLVYDEGLLWVLNQMRHEDHIPKSIKFKVSAHCGHGNPASFKMLELFGADSINPVRDLQLPMLSSLRSTVSVPIDCHTDNPKASGGFMRIYEVPEIVRIASPVYLKSGNSTIYEHGLCTTANDGIKMAKQASIVLEILERHYPDAKQSMEPKY